ncbi:MAG: YifB family Mg chelatase-like AAA ATPase [Pseudomonadales bacterium]|nr:YifB family Mg chelatase-like AAA ATPase [Pseudomonadales bacterium]
MSVSIVYTRAQVGLGAPLVSVETHIANGLPGLSIVGLPEAAVRESKDRVKSAMLNAGFDYPARRITVNLAPADLPKEGGRYDLAIAIGIMAASGQIPVEALSELEFIGELALTGHVRAVKSVLPSVITGAKQGRKIVLPATNQSEALLCEGAEIVPVRHIHQVFQFLTGEIPFPEPDPVVYPEQTGSSEYPDLADVVGQFQAKRALEIAAAGGHHLLFYGPPGTGKSMLASRLPGILPQLTQDEAISVASVRSVANQSAGDNVEYRQWRKRPYRDPHHSASSVALVGGGSVPRPGEVSLAHHGVLFLDELPEFDRKVLEVLREPLETGHIAISRASGKLTFPARFQLVAAMNPCPCGYAGHPAISCTDTPAQVARYRNKISGPLLDRFDLQVEVPAQDVRVFTQKSTTSREESSQSVARRVAAARAIQRARGGLNSVLSGKALDESCELEGDAQLILESAVDRLGMSARALHRIMRVARTIADLSEEQKITSTHLSEALAYRKLDRRPN